MDDDIHMIVSFDIVQAYETWQIRLIAEIVGRPVDMFRFRQVGYRLLRESWSQDEFNVVQGRIGNKIAIWQDVNLSDALDHKNESRAIENKLL